MLDSAGRSATAATIALALCCVACRPPKITVSHLHVENGTPPT